MPGSFRIGELLKSRGLLTEEQVQKILERQKATNQTFGAVASELCGIQEAELWRAWAEQMTECYPVVNPSALTISVKALSFVTPREAWAYRLLPLSISETELTVATTAERLPNAMAFAQIKSVVPVTFCVADKNDLEATIRRMYGLTELPMVA